VYSCSSAHTVIDKRPGGRGGKQTHYFSPTQMLWVMRGFPNTASCGHSQRPSNKKKLSITYIRKPTNGDWQGLVAGGRRDRNNDIPGNNALTRPLANDCENERSRTLTAIYPRPVGTRRRLVGRSSVAWPGGHSVCCVPEAFRFIENFNVMRYIHVYSSCAYLLTSPINFSSYTVHWMLIAVLIQS